MNFNNRWLKFELKIIKIIWIRIHKCLGTMYIHLKIYPSSKNWEKGQIVSVLFVVPYLHWYFLSYLLSSSTDVSIWNKLENYYEANFPVNDAGKTCAYD